MEGCSSELTPPIIKATHGLGAGPLYRALVRKDISSYRSEAFCRKRPVLLPSPREYDEDGRGSSIMSRLEIAMILWSKELGGGARDLSELGCLPY